MTVCTRAHGLAAWHKTPKPAPGASTDRLTVSSARRTHGNSNATKRPRRRPASPAPDSCSATRRPPRFSNGGPRCRLAGPAHSAEVCWVRSPGSRTLTPISLSRRRATYRTAGTNAGRDRASSHQVHPIGCLHDCFLRSPERGSAPPPPRSPPATGRFCSTPVARNRLPAIEAPELGNEP